jgi:hypothetical protein
MANLARKFGVVAHGSLLCVLLWGCGGDECTQGASECLSAALIRTCVPGSDGPQWLISQCGAGATCSKPSRDDEDAGPSDAGTHAPSQPACMGCQPGAHECVSDAVARYCVPGGIWQLDSCAVGQKCSMGECKVGQGSGSVQLCQPGAKACASDKIAKVCDADGTSWVETPCAANQTCSKDACAADPKSSCDDANACLDNKTALRCLGQDQGFELVKCPGATYCETGRCRGAVCALGSTCSGSNQVRECVDGMSLKDTQCGVNEICQQDKDNASCVPLQCMPGTSACGDPRDATVDAKKYFSTCVNGAGSAIPEWVKGECSGHATCNPMLIGSGNPCSQTCTPGAQRCATDALSGVNDGIETCGDDASWGPITSCNPGNDGRLQCTLAPNADTKALPKALCAAPICAWVNANPSAGATGACQGDQLLKCRADGTLADPAMCEHGICRTRRSTITADGHSPGACDSVPECQAGEEQCATANGTVTPRYRTCVNGYWSVVLNNCDNDGACHDAKNDQGLRVKLCGSDCSPGNRRCTNTGQLQECDAQGRWGEATNCAVGSCKGTGNNDAACTAECVPGAKLCSGSTVMAPDGLHAGTTQETTCGADGLRGSAKNCPSGSVCRVSDAGAALGCVACIGPQAPGGNDEGTVDSRCDPQDANKLQECGDDNNWQASRSCANGKHCVGPTSAMCGPCNGARGTSFTCTQSNIAAEPICGGCSVATSSGNTQLSVCSQAMIAATPNVTHTTCVTQTPQSLGAPNNWGGVPDCCASAQTTAGALLNASCTSLGYGAAGAWGNTPDCCANYQLGSGAASFAFCN